MTAEPPPQGAATRRTLLVATTNRGKLREIGPILDGLPFTLVTLAECATVAEPEETGMTFGENARLKARYYSKTTGLVSVADDSGLEIEALDNAPGVHSARYGSDYGFKFRRIQELLRERGANGSAARFVCHVALAHGDEILFEAEATVAGVIVPEPRGENGFGYDPIFLYPPLGRTLAQLDSAAKSSLSHRGKAFASLREYLVAHPAAVIDRPSED
jgi:XTP/dITP diphosphohydrolase